MQLNKSIVLARPGRLVPNGHDWEWSEDTLKSREARRLLYYLAGHFVHWAQAELALREVLPGVPSEILKSCYEQALRRIHPGDPRVEAALSSELDFVAGRGVWLDRQTGKPIKLIRKLAAMLPACQRVVIGPSGHPEAVAIPYWCERVVQGFSPPGYLPVRIVQGVATRRIARRKDEYITFEKQPENEPPVSILPENERMTRRQIRHIMEKPFPRLDLRRLEGILVASICAEAVGRPVIIYLTGPTGSGKTVLPLMAAHIMGSRLGHLQAMPDEEKFNRQLGAYILEGTRVVLIDELAKLTHQKSRIRHLLQLSSQQSFRLLFHSENTEVPWVPAVVITSLALPGPFTESLELGRRIWTARLPGRVPDWYETSYPYGIGGWRASSEEATYACNSLFSHAYRQACEAQFNFAAIAETYGFSELEKYADTIDPRASIDLYQHCRGKFGRRVPLNTPRYRQGRWVDARSPDALPILQGFVPGLSAETPSKSMFERVKPVLSGISWNDVLGLEKPVIVCELRRHGRTVPIRFRKDGRQKDRRG